ncbi:luciferase family oxidoreductase group 1 [Cryobacterium mesophilum]|uniref:LLM class flavin-dependent oxidoreductase n=1 Tax=Terrimesophilobacter mesophilus TaxID=433647 RepID=UPI00184B6A9D|nr:LLM class flavin-dependent oxidoreductase [Terrimesophilobacter mesophilus]MBB5632190.1 luciferase family oxidoreductase group 1 [Terrimesophilobacter mesophilus]
MKAGSPLKLSVLDLVPVHTEQSSSDAIAASIALAKRADDLGFERYWVAEHHNMPAVAATNPPVLIGIIAANTDRIRVGSGGVMLPNHSPLVIAEQFAVLEAAFPARIDLGIGRAPGSDPVITALLRSSGATSDVDEFPKNVQDIRMLLSPDGATLRLGGGRGGDSGRDYAIKATPLAAAASPIWLLGSSDYSARLAASLGLPYVFAHHFSGEGTAQALALYRDGFTPSEDLAAPRTFLTVNAVVADTAEEARALALPQLQQMARLRSGLPLGPQVTVEEAAAATADLPPALQDLIDRMSERWIIDAPGPAATRIRALAAQFGVDEVMISPGAGSSVPDDPRTAPGRIRTLELLAAELVTIRGNSVAGSAVDPNVHANE